MRENSEKSDIALPPIVTDGGKENVKRECYQRQRECKVNQLQQNEIESRQDHSDAFAPYHLTLD